MCLSRQQKDKAKGDWREQEERDEEAEKGKKQSLYPAKRLSCFGKEGPRCRCPLIWIEADRAMTFLCDFLWLQNMHKAATILTEHQNHFDPFVKMFEWLKGNNTRFRTSDKPWTM
jgi:hypothetical protein